MKKNYFYTFLSLFLFLSLTGCINSRYAYENDDDIYNAGKPLTNSEAHSNDSTSRDTSAYYNHYHNYYSYGHPRFYFHPSFYYGGYYPHYWWWGGWWHHSGLYEGAYFGHRGNKDYYGHRKEVATNHPRMGTPHSKPFSARGGFGSTGRGHSSGGFSGGHSSAT